MGKDLSKELQRLRHTTNLLGGSAYDYVAARCLELNHLTFVAMPLFSVAIEKILKAIICEKDNSLSPQSMSHNIPKLFTQVNQYKDYDIARFEGFMPKLEQLFNIRYHDNPKSTALTMVQKDYAMLDDIYIELTDQIRIWPEIKARCGLQQIVFDQYDGEHPIKQWALKDNKALALKLPKWKVEYDQHYKYPKFEKE